MQQSQHIPQSHSTTWRFSLALLPFLIFLSALETWGGTNEETAALGKRLYHEGITVAGKPVTAISQGDVTISGHSAACVKCHRASGFGSSEGGYYVPPITGPLLFAPRKLDRTRLFHDMFQQVQPPRFAARLHQPHMRPAYTTASLGITLREGQDPAGQRLAAIMPRYRLTDADVEALSAYLATLSSTPPPGIDDREIHFATVFSEDVPAAERDAALRTMQKYVDWHNTHLTFDRARPNFSPYHRSDFVPLERIWRLSVWTVTGQPGTWRDQIETFYQQAPAFALVGGMVQGPWTPLAEFCDHHTLPCLLPNTDLPKIENAQGGYSVYFSEGLTLEAKVLAHDLTRPDSPTQQVIQLAATDAFGQTPAQVMERLLASWRPDLPLTRIAFDEKSDLSAMLKEISSQLQAGTTLVIWPGARIQSVMTALRQTTLGGERILLPSRTIPFALKVAGDLPRHIRFIEPHEITVTSHPRSFEVRAWMRTRGLEINHPTLQFQTYYAWSLLEAALAGIREDYFRDYLLERIERESEKDLNPGIYPRLALGPTQRFAAKGAYIVRLDPDQPGRLLAVSDWIVP